MASALFWRSKKGDEDYAQRKQFAAEKRGSRRMSWSPFNKKKKKDAPAAVDPAGWQSPPLTTAVSRPHYSNPVYPSTFFASSFIHSPAPPARRTFPLHSTADFPAPCTPWATGWESTDSFDLAEPEYEDDPAVHVRLGDFRSRAKLTCQSVLSLGKKTVSLGLRRGSRAEGMRSKVWNNVSFCLISWLFSASPSLVALHASSGRRNDLSRRLNTWLVNCRRRFAAAQSIYR